MGFLRLVSWWACASVLRLPVWVARWRRDWDVWGWDEAVACLDCVAEDGVDNVAEGDLGELVGCARVEGEMGFTC